MVCCNALPLSALQVAVVVEKSDGFDSPLTTVRQVFLDSERSGTVNCELSCHTMERPAEVVQGAAPDHFKISPKKINSLAWKPQNVQAKNLKQTNAASFFEAKQLQEGALQLVWRVRHYKREAMIAPAKPLWFVRARLVLGKDQVKRLA